MNPDLINGAMEFISAGLVLWNVLQLYRDKHVAGIALVPAIFFDVWGFWDLYYYSVLDQPISFAGGVCIVIVAMWWNVLAIYYTLRARRKHV